MDRLRIAIVYCYPVTGEPHHELLALRFLQSYHHFSPGIGHETIVIANGGPPDEKFDLFKTMPGFSIFRHDDTGWDLGAYQALVKKDTHDMLVFLGGSSYCRRNDWLLSMASAFDRLGHEHLYGACGHCGCNHIYPHIRTTGFWCAPSLLDRYPVKVTKLDQRYPFEHGPENFTTWVRGQGLKAYVVDALRAWEYPQWNDGPEGYHRGSQRDLLMGDRITRDPYFHTP